MANSYTGQTVTHSAWVAAAVGGTDLQGQIVGILPLENDIMVAISASLPTEDVSLQPHKMGTENTYPVKSTDKLYMKAINGDKDAKVVVTEDV